MCILTSVLLGVLTGICIYMYGSEVRISYELMESIINDKVMWDDHEKDEKFGDVPPEEKDHKPMDKPKAISADENKPPVDGNKPPDDGGNKPPDGKPDFPDPYKGNVKRAFIMVQTGGDGNIKKIEYKYYENEEQSEEEVLAVVKKLIHGENSRGKMVIGGGKYRYMVKKDPHMFDDRKMVFLDRTLEISTISRLMFIFIIIGSMGSVVSFGISILLANWMVKPADRAWTQQKQFVADASHELKTPLTVISSNTDVILASPDDIVKNQSKWLDYIKEETARMTKLVNSMLYIAKYDADQIKFNAVKLNLSEILSSICLQYEALLFESGRLLETDIADNIVISGDEDKIKQLINILLDNAGKYSAENSTIKAVLTKESKSGKVMLTVSNASEEIPRERLERLFDRFYRLDDSRSRKTGGSGLGLNIARSITESHGGKISAHHQDGVTSFTVEFS